VREHTTGACRDVSFERRPLGSPLTRVAAVISDAVNLDTAYEQAQVDNDPMVDLLSFENDIRPLFRPSDIRAILSPSTYLHMTASAATYLPERVQGSGGRLMSKSGCSTGGRSSGRDPEVVDDAPLGTGRLVDAEPGHLHSLPVERCATGMYPGCGIVKGFGLATVVSAVVVAGSLTHAAGRFEPALRSRPAMSGVVPGAGGETTGHGTERQPTSPQSWRVLRAGLSLRLNPGERFKKPS